MFFWLGTSVDTRRVKGGRKEALFCSECNAEATFVEVEIVERLSLFSVVDLLDDRRRAFRCVECDVVGQIVSPDQAAAAEVEDLSPEAAARVQRAREARLAEERERQAKEAEARAAKLDDELLALKRRMGLQIEPAPQPDEAAPSERHGRKKSWWRSWRGMGAGRGKGGT